jgi:hypothetical protein
VIVGRAATRQLRRTGLADLSRMAQQIGQPIAGYAPTGSPSGRLLVWIHFDVQGIFDRSQRSAYLWAISVTSVSSSSRSVIGCRPSSSRWSLATNSSFSAASLRGFST